MVGDGDYSVLFLTNGNVLLNGMSALIMLARKRSGGRDVKCRLQHFKHRPFASIGVLYALQVPKRLTSGTNEKYQYISAGTAEAGAQRTRVWRSDHATKP